ncbi:hypothetical protein O0L34_g1069 [Tuta absoluta]|nr:hypothetical protein O0L34_g1069 [Tuta absoluta]
MAPRDRKKSLKRGIEVFHRATHIYNFQFYPGGPVGPLATTPGQAGSYPFPDSTWNPPFCLLASLLSPAILVTPTLDFAAFNHASTTTACSQLLRHQHPPQSQHGSFTGLPSSSRLTVDVPTHRGHWNQHCIATPDCIITLHDVISPTSLADSIDLRS